MIEVDARPCAADAGPDAMWVSAFAAGSVDKIDPVVNKVVATYHVGAQPCGVAYVRNRLWVGLVSGRQLVQLDTQTGAVRRLDTRAPVFDVQSGLGAVWATTRDGR